MKKVISVFLALMLCIMLFSTTTYASVEVISKFKVEVSSQQEQVQEGGNDYLGEYVMDDDIVTMWHTEFMPAKVDPPHWILLDLEKEYNVVGLVYYPRTDHENGFFTEWEISAGNDKDNLKVVASGSWDYTTEELTEEFPAVKARYIKLEAIESINDFGSAAEIRVLVDGEAVPSDPTTEPTTKPADDEGNNTPKTGDAGSIAFLLAIASVGGIFVNKKRK